VSGVPLKLGRINLPRLADFVTRAIENTSDGLSVKAAMKNLGLKE